MKRYLVLAVLLTLVACREQDGLDPVSGTHLGQHWRATTRLISNLPRLRMPKRSNVLVRVS